jgi:hypothetical protein
MRNDEYISLYDYRGSGSRESGLGQKVYNAAKAKQVQVVYKDIPEDRQKPEYNRVATYPKWFLDEYFEVSPPGSLSDRLDALESKLEVLTDLVTKLYNNNSYVTNSNELLTGDDDDLPF